MDLDKLQQAWQSQALETRVTVDAELLRKEMQRNQRAFQSTILWRDVREVGVGLIMIPVWFYLGARQSLPWSWYLTVPVLVWIAGFILVDRLRRQAPCESGGPLLQTAQNSLAEVDHQIWLLRNIFWWYLLPPTISVLAFFVHASSSRDWLDLLGPSLAVVASFAIVYYANQLAVRWQLEPRRQELLTLLASLNDETSDGARDEATAAIPPVTTGGQPRPLAPTLSVLGLLAAITVLASVAAVYLGRAAADYPKLSPFAAVRWQDSRPAVKVGNEWYELVALNDLPVSQILEFDQQTYGQLWRKRFEEDLVELLSRMGHPPGDSVKLEVQSLTSGETKVLDDVVMTHENRQAIRDAAQTRQNDEPVLEPGPSLLLDKLKESDEPR